MLMNIFNMKEMEATVVDGNGTETGHIIVTTIGGRNGQPKQVIFSLSIFQFLFLFLDFCFVSCFLLFVSFFVSIFICFIYVYVFLYFIFVFLYLFLIFPLDAPESCLLRFYLTCIKIIFLVVKQRFHAVEKTKVSASLYWYVIYLTFF